MTDLIIALAKFGLAPASQALLAGEVTPMTDWPKYSAMSWLRLLEGPGNLVIIPVAPTMKRLIYAGEKYNRMAQTRSTDDAGTYGGAYLWDGWMAVKLAEMGEREPAGD